MRMSFVDRRMPFAMLFGVMLLCLLAACGNNVGATSNTTTGSSQAGSTAPKTSGSVVAYGTAAEQALLPMMTLVGQPAAKLISGHHVFEADGKIKNGDSKQHDIYIQVTLLDASGAIVGSTAFYDIDNVPGDGTASFAIRGTTIQPTWTSVQVKVVGITENIGASGGD